MNLSKNYYNILGVSNKSSEKEIKKAYYKLSFTHHPDRGGDSNIFSEITEAYDVLCSEVRSEYDQKSKFGNNYNEYFELFNSLGHSTVKPKGK
jgi:DnaJ family protein A protein 2